MEEKIVQVNTKGELPEWVLALMRACEEYVGTLEAEDVG